MLGLALIPAAAYFGGFILIGNLQSEPAWRRAALRAAILWAAYAILTTEILSVFSGVTPLNLSISWLLPAFGFVLWALPRRAAGTLRLPRLRGPESTLDQALLLGIVLILLLTLMVAWLAPPQTWDSLRYHMTRVAHWAQLNAVRHFPTGIEEQNSMPPAAEMLILQLYVLTSGDRLVNLVQWFAMLGSLLGASLVAKELGAGRRGQMLSMAFAASLPVGIAQATSTKTDYVVAFWVIALASEAVPLLQGRLGASGLFFSSAAAGLALLTKPTAAAYVLPFGILVGGLLLRRLPMRQTLLWAVMAITVVGALNAGHLTRNYRSYGNPISPPDRIELHANQLRDARGFLSNLLRNAALHAGTPSPHVNKAIALTVLTIHDLMGLDPNDPRTTTVGVFRVRPPSTHEDLVGNTLHAILILGLLSLMLWQRRSLPRKIMIYAPTVVAGFLVYSFAFKWQIFGSRYHLPFFILFAPLAGFLLGRRREGVTGAWIGLALLIAASPWVVGINSRPLLPHREAFVESILQEPRQDLYFANGPHLMRPYRGMSGRIKNAGCGQVGLMLLGNSGVYPLWALLDAPRDTLEVEWIVADSPSARYQSPDFSPCAVVCQDCPPDWQVVRGLPLAYEMDAFRLYQALDQEDSP